MSGFFSKYSSRSPSRQKPMTLSFAFASWQHALATFFGSGVLRPGSGTYGSLAAWLVYAAVGSLIGQQSWSLLFWGLLTAMTFLIGAYVCEVTGRDIGVHDHSSVVIDEVFAVWLVMMCVPATFVWQLAAFAAFRFFDIVKLPPARYFDVSPRWQNGWGVMLDDLVAAVQAVILLRLALFVLA